MLLLRPDLVDDAYRELPPATYSWPERVRANYPLKDGGQGYVGHPGLADPEFARATSTVLMDEAMALVHGLLDGKVRMLHRRSPFYALPFFRTNFWPAITAAGVLAGAAAGAVITVLSRRSSRS